MHGKCQGGYPESRTESEFQPEKWVLVGGLWDSGDAEQAVGTVKVQGVVGAPGRGSKFGGVKKSAAEMGTCSGAVGNPTVWGAREPV